MEAYKQHTPNINQLIATQLGAIKTLNNLGNLTSNEVLKQLMTCKSRRIRQFSYELKEALLRNGEWFGTSQEDPSKGWTLTSSTDTPEHLMGIIKQHEEIILSHYSTLISEGFIPLNIKDILYRQRQMLSLSMVHVDKLAQEIL